MKVMQIGSTYFGTAQGMLEHAIIQGIKSAGFEGRIAYADDYGNEKKEREPGAFKIYSSIDWFFRKLNRKIDITVKPCALLPTLRLIDWIRKEKPDIIHIHVIHHDIVLYNYLLKYINRKHIPVVFTMHDFWCMTGGCYHFYKRNCTGYMNGCKECHATRKELDNSVYKVPKQISKKSSFFNCDNNYQFIAVSNWMVEIATNSILPKNCIKVIYNGVNTEIFKQQSAEKHRKNNSRVTIVSVASFWSEAKGINKFIEFANFLGENYDLVLIGNHRLYSENELPKNIKMPGVIINKNCLADYYNKADLFLSFSVEETFGVVIAEAACCGIPVVGYDATGIAEVIKSANGVCVPVDADLLTIKNAIDDSITNYKTESCSRSREIFDINTMVEKYIAVYKDLIIREKE